MNTRTTSSDAGSLRRGVVLLKLLATAGRKGLALTELASKAQLPHPSAHRVLAQLIAENLAVHSPETRRYRLGPLAFELGVAGSTLHDIRDLCDGAMAWLAKETGDTVYLVVRSGFDAVCMHRREGEFPIRALVLEVGSRRPLGVGAGGLAILSAIDDDDRHEIIERVAPALPAFDKLTPELLAAACQQAREDGAAVIQNRVSLGVRAVGLAFRDSIGQPVGALSVAALTQRLSARRTQHVAQLLAKATQEVEGLMRKRKAA
ncbi:IclR family transcriptional regulator [uncultured Pseudacidovorax sp.]|uniref:IclR family transcriptional regulator n=1 Tax=uncultured Pseudacidovorax sp. TaxID=679313 RepID=UPI0025F81ADD|nr:IclR family transcriptional regulator [uncultured Pseudacidovorax sp.]